ncbi:cupin domain-containing protein [Amycolatopsis sp.]|uniref:cupin domain-containing protein n=1 Tax=Amycolatopsis sp. TaxID=37632 RepID=UPI002D8009FE|nr:cupin domain-containing protein [Amycolatopsis sp.]HET6709689.1 cupin domain-containing protein [Amycolatopsis sp.]
MPAPPTRVVTGHDGTTAVITSLGPPKNIVELQAVPGVVFHELWNTTATPPVIDNGPDPTGRPLRIRPPANGTILRMIDYPPDTDEFLARSADDMRAAFREMGEDDAGALARGARHPGMHRTETIDYAVVVSGTITLVLDDSETELAAGDVVIQRGTNHAWANRSGAPARVLFVLIDARYDAQLTGKP